MRNGLATFGADLFLDPALAEAPASTLLEEAFHLEFPTSGDGTKARAPRRLHALLAVEEVSLLSAPDAVQRGWLPTAAAGPDAIGAPVLNAIAQDADGVHFAFTWSSVFSASDYVLEEAENPRFTDAQSVWHGVALTATLERPSSCPRTLYYRVRARRTGAPGPWSNTRRLETGGAIFEACEHTIVDAPALRLTPIDAQRVMLEWDIASAGADAVRIELAGEPTFASPRVVLADDRPGAAGAHSLAVWTLPGLTSYFRLAVRRGDAWSPWSATAMAAPAPDAARTADVVPADDADDADLLVVHRAMLRFCAARGDLFATLCVPAHFRDDATLSYRGRLADALRSEDGDRTLSFGALYHPWPVSRDGARVPAAALRRVPPDGAACGVIAARTIAGGAWLAPANRALRDVLALEPSLAEGAPRRFYDAQVNLLRQQPAGFVVLAADTLSDDADLRPIGTRRLLILLRRLAIREGTTYVFEPNDIVLRRRVQRQFELLLSGMFARGAFAGTSRDEGFRVVADGSVNTIESLALGRFVVELRVAAAQPLAFLTVRLVQSGGELMLSESA
jgi:hypothetical protein